MCYTFDYLIKDYSQHFLPNGELKESTDSKWPDYDKLTPKITFINGDEEEALFNYLRHYKRHVKVFKVIHLLSLD
jgi:hypothetical protein